MTKTSTSSFDRPWSHRALYAGVHTRFTRRMCFEQMCAHVIDNYLTDVSPEGVSITSREGRFSFSFLNPEERSFFAQRLDFYRRLRRNASENGTDFNLHYRTVPEYLESHHALVLDQPDIFRDFD